MKRMSMVTAGAIVACIAAKAGAFFTSSTEYLVPVTQGITLKSILTVGDSVNGYRMVGVPDGLGAFDNGDGTFTLLMNHELTNAVGVPRAHHAGAGQGAFVSKWVIRKSTLEVLSGEDLIHTVIFSSLNTSLNFNRFCSADLPAVSAFYNAATGMGTQDRIFMNGEEVAGGRAFGHVVTGPFASTSYELPLLGTFAHENVVANPFAQDTTIVAGLDDTSPGRVFMYIGLKLNTGTPVDKAGLTNGVNYAVQVQVGATNVATESRDFGLATAGPGVTTNGTFSLVDPNGVAPNNGTFFLRPEDGAWDPTHPADFYFVTTDRLDTLREGLGTQVGRSRLWRLHFTDMTNPLAGGTVTMLLLGTEGGNMFDNIAFDRVGRIVLQEDTGSAEHNAKVWLYEVNTGELKMIAKHDPARFGDITTPATAPFTVDEESSGVIDVSDILGPGSYLLDVQAHYNIGDAELVEGGQLLVLHASGKSQGGSKKK